MCECKATYEVVKKVVEKERLDAEIEYVTDMNEAVKPRSDCNPSSLG